MIRHPRRPARRQPHPMVRRMEVQPQRIHLLLRQPRQAMTAKRLIMLTDVSGVMNENNELLPDLTVSEARKLIEDGTIHGGMIPKVETCIAAVEAGVEGAVISDGRVAHAVLVELFTEHGAGTIIRPD